MQRRRSKYIVALALAALAALVVLLTAEKAYLLEGGEGLSSAEFSSFASIFDPRPLAPHFSLVELGGRRVELKDLAGKVTLINFRATW